MQPSINTYATMILQTFAKLGVPVPKDLTAAQERAKRAGRGRGRRC